MTIGENNKLIVGVGHPRVIGGVIIKLNMVNSSRKVENDISYLEFPREPLGNTLEDSANYPIEFFKGPETLATDMLKVQNTFEPTVRIKTQGEGAESALPDYMVDDENNDIASVSRADDNGETLIFDRYNDPIHIGATKIREDSEVVIGPDGSTLVKGDDYILDPNIGRIALLQGGPNHSGLDAEYTISYDFKNTPRNIAETLAKIPVMGGASIYAYDIDQEFTGSSSGKEYTVFVEAVRKELDPNRPQEAEVSFDMREAVMIDFDQI